MHEYMELTVEAGEAGSRLDRFISGRLPEYTRSRIQKLTEDGFVLADGKPAKASHKSGRERR